MTNEELITTIRNKVERQFSVFLNLSNASQEYGYHKALEFVLSVLSDIEKSEKPSGPTIEEPIDGVLYAAACGIKNATGKSEKSIDEYKLENELDNYVEENGLVNCSEIAPIARHFAQWGAEHLKK